MVDGHEYELDCIVYATGFEPEVTPLPRRARSRDHRSRWRTIAEKWAGGEATLFGLMTAGFPNLFLMPCPGHQAVVTVNYTLLTEVAAEYVADDHRRARRARRPTSSTSPRRPRRTGSDRSSPPTTPTAAAAPPGGVPCTPGSRMLFDDDGQHGDPRSPRGHLRRWLRRLLRLPRPARRNGRSRATSPA